MFRFLKRLGIKKVFALGYIVMLSLFTVTFVLLFSSNDMICNNIKEELEHSPEIIKDANEINAFIFAIDKSLQKLEQCTSDEQLQFLIEDIYAYDSIINKVFTQLSGYCLRDENTVADAKIRYLHYKDSWLELIHAKKRVISDKELKQAKQNSTIIFQDASNKVLQIIKSSEDISNKIHQKSKTISHNSRLLIIIAFVLFLLAILSVGYLLLKITRPINYFSELLNEKTKINSQDKLIEQTLNLCLGITNNRVVNFYRVNHEQFTATRYSLFMRKKYKAGIIKNGQSIEFSKSSESVSMVMNKILEANEKNILVDGKIQVAIVNDKIPVGLFEIENQKNSISEVEKNLVKIVINNLIANLYKEVKDEQLKQSELKYNQFFESTPIQMHSMDIDGCITNMNSKWLYGLNYSKDEVVFKEFSDFLSPDSQVRYNADFIELKNNGRINNKQYQIKAGNGSLLNILFTAEVQYDLHNKIVSIQAGFVDVTELYAKDQQLKENQKIFEKVFNVNNSAMVITDNETRKIYAANDAFLLFFGYSRDEVIGKSAEELKLWDKEFAHYNFIRDTVQKEGIMRNFDFIGNRKDGTKINILVNATLVRIKNKPYTLATGINITELKKKQQALEKSENQYRRLFSSNKDAILLSNNDRKIINCNKAFENLFGYKLSNIYNRNEKLLYSNEKYYHELGKVFSKSNSDIPHELLVEYKCKDGSFFLGETTPYFIEQDDDKAYNALIIRDVTYRNKLELENTRLKTAVEQSGNSIVITNNIGDIQYVNKAFSNLTGYTFNEVINKSTRILKSGKHDTAFYEQIWNTILDGRIWSGQIQNRKKSGEIYWELNTISPVFNNKGEIINFIAIKRDISQQLAMKQELMNAILNTELTERKQFAENLHDDLGPFLSGIKLYIREIDHNDLQPEQKAQLINDMKLMVDDAIDITRSLSHKLMPSVLVDYGLEKALISFCDKIAALNQIKINLVCNITNEINKNIELTVYRITIELINNTIKHAQATIIDININVHNNYFTYNYADNGTGFNVKDQMKGDKGIGLKNINNRLSNYSIDYSLESEKNKGMNLNFVIDLQNLYINPPDGE